MTFTIPLTFYNTTCLNAGPKNLEQFNAIESTLVSSRPTSLRSWNASGDLGGGGVVVGCEDGTLYLFHTLKHEGIAPVSPLEKRRRRPQNALQTKRSRPSSPSSHPLSPTFNVASRATVSLGLTTEQVQAPRNYVDFDDEPERLKDILKGRNPRERSSSDAASLVTISPAPSVINEPASAVRMKESYPKSHLSTSNSAGTSPKPPSSPTSPQDQSFETIDALALQCHIIPIHAGYGNAIRSIEMLEDNTVVIALQESGHLGIYSSRDGSCLATAFAPDYCGGKRASRDIWTWTSLQLAFVDETPLLLVTAATDSNSSAATPDTEENSTETSQAIVLKLSFTPNALQMDQLTSWDMEGPAKGIGIFKEPDDSSSIFSINSQGHFLVRSIRIKPSSETSSTISPPPESESLPHLSLPKSLKAIVARSSDHVSLDAPHVTTPQVTLDENVDVGNLISDSTLIGLSARSVGGKLYGIVWAHREMIIFEYHACSLSVLSQVPVTYLEDVVWLDDEMYALSYQDRIEVHRLQCANADNDHLHQGLAKHDGAHSGSSLICQIPTGGHDAYTFSPTELILAKINGEGHRQIISFKVAIDEVNSSSRNASTILWQSSVRHQVTSSALLQTSSVPLELEVIVQGFSDGRLQEYSLDQLAFRNENVAASALKQSEPAVGASIVGLNCTQNPTTKERYIIGGADDGSILLWNMSTFELCARWIVFSTPLVRVVEFQNNASPLRGCVLCIARDGTLAVIAVDQFQFLYLIPGSPTPLTRISLGESNLVLIYGESIARLWDIQTKEFWRSMSVEKAEEMFGQGGWTALDMAGGAVARSMWGTVAPSFNGTDAAATLDFSLDKFVIDCMTLTKTISTSRDEIRKILQVLERLRILLSILVTPGLNSDVDSICVGKLKLRPSSVGVGLSSYATTTLYPTNRPQEVWSISCDVSAARMLAIVFILRAMSLFEELSEASNTAIAFYTSSLNSCVGPQYAQPSLEWLGKRWFAAASNLRQSIRVVFDATLSQISDQDAMKLAEKWQQHVPSLQPQTQRESELSALALLICGSIATAKFSLLSVNALTDISKSITLYLHDENSSYRVLAIELCSKGFHVWQHYVDTMEILRALFTLSTNVRKDTISAQNVSAQARLAVLSIATHHTQLFMSTLCLDVLNPPSLDHRRAVMQIIAFLIRKRRHILQPNLPRLMEAVVKSLDPNANANREAVLDTATEIIGFVVRHFPTIDFHMASQRLAVGTNEGAVVMYDLKTAIRLYVLEGHKKQLAACSFSPDGRRLVTLSLVEQAVLVWKVGSSFSSFFNPGAPPRQGHGGSEPFKTLNFNIGSEADMTVEESLDLIKFEWVADRSVKVKIRDSILTFST